MNKYWEYFKYVMEHKKNVFIECWKEGLYFHAFTHDLSKFLPKEFKAYAVQFYGDKWCHKCVNYNKCSNIAFTIPERYEPKNNCKEFKYKGFDKAWEHHYKHNKHHWNYWIGQDMPYKYIRQMICDWKAMSRKFGGTVQEFYLKNYNKMNLCWSTRLTIEHILNLNDSDYHNYGHTLEQFAQMYNKETYDKHFGFIRDEYGIDSYELFEK